jgi:BirA family biotin operon repressor/biotin-[acetyl-CoA-carboxylase] ligase
VIVGMGVNLNVEPGELPPELKETATSLKAARGQHVLRALFTAALWTRLENWLDRHAAEGFGPVREAWKQLSATLGHEVLVKSEAREVRGIAEDIDEAGALLVRRSDGALERILAGDVEQVRSRKS